VVTGYIAGIRVLEDFGLVGSQPLGRHHGGHNGTSATSLPNARLEVLGQTEVIPLRDGLQDLLVEFRGFVVSVVMREIGAGHDERACSRPLERFGEREPKGTLRFIVLLTHHDGNQLEVTQHALQKRELHLQGVLALLLGWNVATAGKLDERVQLGQLGGELLVHRDISERRGIGIAVVNRNEREALEMRGRNHHYPLELSAFEQRVTVCSHFAGIDVARVRRNQRHQVPRKWRYRGLRQIVIQHAPEFVGLRGIELASNGRLPDRGLLIGQPAIAR